MAPTKSRPSLLVVVGPTASGKSELALKIAKQRDGEIISADSRTIYKDMDIGTAKPTRAEQRQAPHWGLDLIRPDMNYSVHKFKDYAESTLKDVQKRGKLPILVGGAGLYIDAVLYSYKFDAPDEPNPLNPRHRALSGSKARTKVHSHVMMVGIDPGAETTKQSITRRTEQMFNRGVVNETKELMLKYGQEPLRRNGGIVYRVCIDLLAGRITEQEAKLITVQKEYQYSRRQKIWFKRNPDITWFADIELCESYILHALNT